MAGNRGNFFCGAALGAAAGFVRDRGLGPRAHLPARSPRTVAALPSAPATVKVGCRLPSLSPAKGGSRVGTLPAPFCRAPEASSPAGRRHCRAASPWPGSAGRRAGHGQTPPWPPGGREAVQGSATLLPPPSTRPVASSAPLRPRAPGQMGETAEKRKFS